MDEYKAEIENQLSSVQSDLQAQCKNNMGTSPPVVVLSSTVKITIVGRKVGIRVATCLFVFKL